jgi:hypothetical protein
MIFHWMVFSLVASSPLWVPIAFACYAIGRRQYGMRFMLALATAETIAIVVSCALFFYHNFRISSEMILQWAVRS